LSQEAKETEMNTTNNVLHNNQYNIQNNKKLNTYTNSKQQKTKCAIFIYDNKEGKA
jgi:hypothetical protein